MSVHTLWHRISPKLKKSLNYFFLWLSGHEISSKCTFIQRSRSKSRTKFLYAKCKEIKKTKFIANNLKLADWGWVTLFCKITQPHPTLASKILPTSTRSVEVGRILMGTILQPPWVFDCPNDGLLPPPPPHIPPRNFQSLKT